jgi:CheY-like chemotaxis protein
MKTRLVAAGLLMLAGIGAGDGLLACGDKFLVLSRGTRFQRATTARLPAEILAYANPESVLLKALANLPIEQTLRKAGYHFTSVANGNDLDTALRKGGWDLVLVDVADGQAVTSRIQGERAPVVLPVVYNATGSEVAQVKKQYQCVLKSPIKTQSFLDSIDEALALRSKQRADGRKIR